MGIFSYVKAGKKVFDTITKVKPNVPKTKLEKATSKLNIAKHKTKMSKAKLNQTLFNIDQASKKAKARAQDKRNEKIVKKFIGEK
jgi:multidrug resistance efflux pump